jgi:tetratricopeptide (TPR) repeat protein
MRIIGAALAAAFSAALVTGALAQSSATPSPSPPDAIGPGPGDVLPAPHVDPALPEPPGQPGDTATKEEEKPPVQLTREEQLDQLFAALQVAPNEEAAKAVERRISGIWSKSGSDTIDLLIQWADDAIDAKDYPLALDYLDRITALKPDYVEGWDKRANVFFMIEEFGKSLVDIERVLALEPRHFGALAGLGSIMRQLGEEQKAAAAYRRALEIDPYLDTVKQALDQLQGLERNI